MFPSDTPLMGVPPRGALLQIAICFWGAGHPSMSHRSDRVLAQPGPPELRIGMFGSYQMRVGGYFF